MLLLPATFFAGAFLVMIGAQEAKAEEEGQAAGDSSAGNYNYVVPKRRRPGGYSRLNLSDIWGPAEMPPAPMDFGPGFDFTPGGYTLEGVPNDSPYPN
jgi:hypothetical protein